MNGAGGSGLVNVPNNHRRAPVDSAGDDEDNDDFDTPTHLHGGSMLNGVLSHNCASSIIFISDSFNTYIGARMIELHNFRCVSSDNNRGTSKFIVLFLWQVSSSLFNKCLLIGARALGERSFCSPALFNSRSQLLSRLLWRCHFFQSKN